MGFYEKSSAMLNFPGRISLRCFRDGEGAVASYLVCDVISFWVVKTKGYCLIYLAGDIFRIIGRVWNRELYR